MRIRERVQRLERAAPYSPLDLSGSFEAAKRFFEDFLENYEPLTPEEELKRLRAEEPDRSFMDEALPEQQRNAYAVTAEFFEQIRLQRIEELEKICGD